MYDDVRRVGIRQFQQNFHKELPFIVTKDGNDYCVVTPFTAINDIANILRPNDVTTPVTTDPKNIVFPQNLRSVDVHTEPPTFTEELVEEAPEAGRCEMPGTGCRGIGRAYQVTFPTGEGEQTNKYFLCDKHLADARKKYKVTEL